jgi:hypothetical protein
MVDDDDPATGACDVAHDDLVSRTRRPGTLGTLHVAASRSVRVTRSSSTAAPRWRCTGHCLGLAVVLSLEALVCLLDAALNAS